MGATPIRVFISHAWDQQHPQYREQVRALAELLAAGGIDVRLDLYMQHVPYDWTAWVTQQLATVDYVIVVASPAYKQRAEDSTNQGDGRGVVFEAALLRDRISSSDRDAWSQKIITVVLPGFSPDDVPWFLLPSARTWYPIKALSPAGIDAVLRVLYAEPKYERPVIGPRPLLQPAASALATLANLDVSGVNEGVDPLVEAVRPRQARSPGSEQAASVRFEPEGRIRRGLRALLPRRLRGRPPARGDDDRLSGRVHEEIGPLIASLGLPGSLGDDVSPAGLRRLLRRLPEAGVEAARLRSIVDSLLVCDETIQFVSAALPRVDSAALRRSLRRADIPEDETPAHDERELLTHLALRFPLVDGDCRRQMVRFIVALAVDQRADLDGSLVDNWADRIGASRVLVNDARNALTSRALIDRLRLVINLVSADLNAVWPTTVMAWLEDETNLVGPAEEQCRPEGADVERAILRLIDWGNAEARKLGIDLHNIEIAATTGLLLENWHPGSIRYLRRLADHFSVTTRWSERLRPSTAMARSIDYSIAQLKKIADQTDLPPIDWVDEDDLDDAALLNARLVDGVYDRALGLPRRPAGGARVLRLALTHSPIVIWPHSLDSVSPAARAQLAAQWRRLPHAFHEQYARRWRGLSADDLAELRAVWDDARWLTFCARFQYTP